MHPQEQPPAQVQSVDTVMPIPETKVTMPDGKEVSMRKPLEFPLTAQKLEQLMKALFQNPGMDNYETLMMKVATQFQRERLRQEKNTPKAPEDERSMNDVWQTYYEYIPGKVLRYYSELKTYADFKEALAQGKGFTRKYDLSATEYTKEWEQSGSEFTTALSLVLRTRVQIGTFGQLINRRAELLDRGTSLNDPQVQELTTAIAQAKKALPDAVEIRSPEVQKKIGMLKGEIPGITMQKNRMIISTEGFRNADELKGAKPTSQAVQQKHSLMRTAQALDTEVNWYMSFSAGVPGAPKDMTKWELALAKAQMEFGIGTVDIERALPSDRLQVDLLSRALRENVEEERKLQVKGDPKLTQKAIDGLRADRRRIIIAMLEWERRVGSGTLEDLKKVGIHHTFGDKFEGPADAPFGRVMNDPEMRKYIDAAFDHEVAKFDRHIEMTLGKQGAMRLTLGDELENMWNKNRHGIHTFVEALVAVRMSPRDLIRNVVPGADYVVDSGEKARADALKSIRTALGFPENYDPLKSDAENGLTEAHKKVILEKLKSIKDVVKEFLPQVEKHAKGFQDTVATLRALKADPEANPDALLGVEPVSLQELQPFLVEGKVTPETLQKIKATVPEDQRKAYFVAAHFRSYEQFEEHWNAYMDGNVQYFDKLENVLNTHLDLAGAYNQAANNLWPSLYALGGVLAAYYIGARGGMARFGITRLAAQTAGGVRRIPFGRGPITWTFRGVQRVANAPLSVLDRAGTSAKFAFWNNDFSKAGKALWDPAHPSLKVERAAASTASGAAETTQTVARFEHAADSLKALSEGEKGIKELTAVLSRDAQMAELLAKEPNLLKALMQSSRAKGLLQGALKTGETAEVMRTLRCVGTATKLKVGLGALGIGADVLGILTAYVDYQEAGGKLEAAKQTNNEALQDIYRGAQERAIVVGEVSTISLVVTGFAIVKTGSFVAGTAASVALVPVAIAAGVGHYIASDLDAASENWLKGEKDWLQLSAPELLNKLKEIKPGKEGFFRSTAVGFDNAATANEMASENILRAYLIKTSILPKNKDEDEASYKRRMEQFISDQVDWFRFASSGMMFVDVSQFEMARQHAKLSAASRQAQQLGMHLEYETKDAKGKKRTVALEKYTESFFNGTKANKANEEKKFQDFGVLYRELTKESRSQLAQVRDSKETVENKRRIAQEQLLMEVQDYMQQLDAKMLEADFDGIGEADVNGRFDAMYTASKELRIILFQESDKLLAAKTPADMQKQWNQSIARVRGTLAPPDVVVFQKRAVQRGWDKERGTDRQAFLSLPWVLPNLYLSGHPGW